MIYKPSKLGQTDLVFVS